MKEKLLTLISVLAIGSCCLAQKQVVLSNPTGISRPDELIVLKRSDMARFIGPDKPFLKIAKGKIDIPLQFDDLDQDGIWDEAVFLYSFAPLEKVVLNVETSPDKSFTGKTRAHVRQMRKGANDVFGANLSIDSIPQGQPNTDFSKVKLPPFLTEGPAWENDKVGFRLYFDIRNGKDIWGKTTEKMMMDSVGVDPSVIYHNRAAWGMDIYKVGSSLSAGALALNLKLTSGKDSLIRLGGKNMGKVIYKKIADGPIRAIFRLFYPGWHFADGYPPMSLTEEISIWGGQYFYQSKVRATGIPKNAQLVTGFANLYGVPSKQLSGKNASLLYSYGLQSENKDSLGLAILASKKEMVSFGCTGASENDIKDSYLVSLKIKDSGQATGFRFFSAWESSDERFRSSLRFEEYLSQQILAFEKKIKISWK